jgi:hypothetical protein
MSRGLGKLERKIISELTKRDHFALNELLIPGYTKAQYNALYRAMRNLEIAGQIIVFRFWLNKDRTWICRPGIRPTVEDRNKLKRNKSL